MPERKIALAVLVAIHALAILAEPLAPYPGDQQHRDQPYAPPSRLHVVDRGGRWHLVPFVYAAPSRAGVEGPEAGPPRLYPLRFLVHGTPYRLAGIVPLDRHLVGVDSPATLFLLGTDRYGRDILSRLLLGARLSLFAGLLATLVSLGLGTLVGGIAGYHGGWLDAVLMRATDGFLALPWLYLLLAVRNLLPLDLPPAQAFVAVVTLVGGLGFARPARLMRGVAWSARGRDYVLAARGCGASATRVLTRHVLPQAGAVALTQGAILAPRYVLAEITLSFLGLGIAEPTASLGTLAAGVLPPGQVLSHWWLAAPLVAMVPVFALYDLVATALAQPGPAGMARVRPSRRAAGV